jgi:hypothetical protein
MAFSPLRIGSVAILLAASLAAAAAAQTTRSASPIPSAPSSVVMAAPAPVPAWRPTWTRSFAFNGNVDGLTLVGADDTQEVWIPLPQRLTLEEARLRLPWRAQLPGYHIATLSVSLNGRPAGAWRIDGAGGHGVFEIPLSAQDLRAEGLRVVFHLRGGLGGDWCADERFARGFVQILPEGGLEARHRPPRDVGAHLEALPQDVRLAVPSPATDAEMRAALAVAVLLERAGHRVAFQEGHAAGAHVAVAAGSSRIGTSDTIDLAFGALGGDGVAAVDGVVLVAAGETAPGVFTALGRRLAGAATMGVNQATAGAGGRRFAELGLSDRDIRVLEEGSLAQTFHLRDLPAGRWPEAVDISLVAPPRQGAAPMLAYLHINGVLAGVHPLGDQGGEQRLRFHLPREAIGVSNQLRLTLQREAPSGACRTQPVPALFQWRADSMLHLADAPEHATDAATFTALHYAPTMTVSPEALARPAAALAAATFVLRDALRPVVPPAAAGGQALIHLGRLPVETARRLDLQPERGIARIVGPDASRLFLDGVPTPAGMHVLANGVLEILPAREAFRPADGRIHREAAAAFDARGIVARADADPRVAPLPPPTDSPAAVASSWASWLLRLAIGLGGAVLGGLAVHLWRRRI